MLGGHADFGRVQFREGSQLQEKRAELNRFRPGSENKKNGPSQENSNCIVLRRTPPRSTASTEPLESPRSACGARSLSPGWLQAADCSRTLGRSCFRLSIAR